MPADLTPPSLATMTTSAASPPAASYPSGHAGIDRAWDGEAWTGPAITNPDAPALHALRSLGRTLRRLPVWIAVAGIFIGLALSAIGVSGKTHNTPVLLVAGFVATGGPILALILGVHRRLGIGSLPARQATLAGLGSAVVAMGVAYSLETWLTPVLGGKTGAPSEGLLLLAGPIEEGAKLLVPVILLVAGVGFVRTPRLGVWAVLLSSGLFGAFEGALYAANLGGARTSDTGEKLAEALKLSTDSGNVAAELMSLSSRIWVELGHPIWTTGAAVLIWLAVHNGRKALSVVTLIDYLAAAALHSFNDGVLTLLPSTLPVLGSIVWLTLSYVRVIAG